MKKEKGMDGKTQLHNKVFLSKAGMSHDKGYYRLIMRLMGAVDAACGSIYLHGNLIGFLQTFKNQLKHKILMKSWGVCECCLYCSVDHRPNCSSRGLYQKKKKKDGEDKKWLNETTNPLHLSELAQSSLFCSWICIQQIMVVGTMKAP